MILAPYNVDVPMERWPIANWCLMAFTIAISIDAFSGTMLFEGLQVWMMHGGGVWATDAGLLGNIFTHADPFHLLGNMMFLFVFGNAVNAKLGHALFLSCYVALGIISTQLFAMFFPDAVGLGASGAIAGITGMFIVFFPKNNVSVFFGMLLLFRPIGKTFQVSAWLVIGAYFLKDLAFQILESTTGADSGVALMAHLGGTVAGVLIAAALLISLRVVPGKYETTLVDLARERMQTKSA
jgi:membrane associated rhomboid family serine protease